MAILIKDKKQDNQTDYFNKVNQVIGKKRRLRKFLIGVILMSLGSVAIADYYYRYTPYYNYSLYGAISFMLLFIVALWVIGPKVYKYHTYHKNVEFKEREDKLDKRFKENLMDILGNDKFKVLNNVYLPCSDNYLQQIDTIIFGLNHIYVIKIMKASGIIGGMVGMEYWNFGKDKRIFNPYKSNQGNVEAVEELVYNLIFDKKIRIYNVVVNLELNSNFNLPDKGRFPIFDNLYDSLYWIKSKEQGNEEIISEKEQQKLIDYLLELHSKSLLAVEKNINNEVLRKYNLL
ncbi:hypothetical protein U472_11205 [Orenia metallireducens]|jgi:hypothetical protein|uniref:NERD domain-containing protein n=1 Tax=Orenia metallireducens TaxID=1413210 RepID=A0A1C0A8K8_9FIRM|nr:nuclease-related domain-containing protein [Orenia metallireducens]OCL26551.1 hypothetical protein U472_11205 [Orenia metallireducens]